MRRARQRRTKSSRTASERALRGGQEAFLRWRRRNPSIRIIARDADLRGLRLSGVALGRADLRGSNLEGAQFHSVDLGATDLRGCELAGATFTNASAHGTRFDGARVFLTRFIGGRLEDCSFRDAVLRQVDFRYCSLVEGRFDGCVLAAVLFQEVELVRPKGLGAAVYEDPSSMDMRTLELLAREYGAATLGGVRRLLRATGMPPDLINEFPQSVLTPDRSLARCFVSYSEPDGAIADRLIRMLRRAHVRCWTFAADARPGQSVWSEISRSIGDHDKVVVLCSRRSLHSPGVLREIERALTKEDELVRRAARHAGLDTKVLIPVALDGYLLGRWQHERRGDVLTNTVLDLTDSSPAKYRAACRRLLAALGADS